MYSIKTKFPKEEVMDNTGSKFVTTSKQEQISVDTAGDVIELYNQYASAYAVTVSIAAPEQADGEESDVSPFEIAEELTKNGIDYKATLKIKNGQSFEEATELINAIDASGFEYTADIKLKINDATTANIRHVDTWTEDDTTVVKLTPKASSIDINELKPLFDKLTELELEPTIDIKPKAKSTDDEANDFAAQLSAYPDGSEITFTLKDGE